MRVLVLVKAWHRFERRRSRATSSNEAVPATQDKAKRRMANRVVGGGFRLPGAGRGSTAATRPNLRGRPGELCVAPQMGSNGSPARQEKGSSGAASGSLQQAPKWYWDLWGSTVGPSPTESTARGQRHAPHKHGVLSSPRVVSWTNLDFSRHSIGNGIPGEKIGPTPSASDATPRRQCSAQRPGRASLRRAQVLALGAAPGGGGDSRGRRGCPRAHSGGIVGMPRGLSQTLSAQPGAGSATIDPTASRLLRWTPLGRGAGAGRVLKENRFSAKEEKKTV
jgi:hypothetical protein